MFRIQGHNSDVSNTYTVTARTTGSSGVDIFPSSDFGFTVNPEAYDAVVSELGTFSGVTWYVYNVQYQVRSTILEPSSISGANHDWSPTDWASGSYSVIAVAATGLTPSVTGLAGGVHERRATLLNIGSVAISLPAQDNSSAAANQFIHPGLLGAFSLGPNESVDMIYHGGSVNRWRFLG